MEFQATKGNRIFADGDLGDGSNFRQHIAAVPFNPRFVEGTILPTSGAYSEEAEADAPPATVLNAAGFVKTYRISGNASYLGAAYSWDQEVKAGTAVTDTDGSVVTVGAEFLTFSDFLAGRRVGESANTPEAITTDYTLLRNVGGVPSISLSVSLRHVGHRYDHDTGEGRWHVPIVVLITVSALDGDDDSQTGQAVSRHVDSSDTTHEEAFSLLGEYFPAKLDAGVSASLSIAAVDYFLL